MVLLRAFAKRALKIMASDVVIRGNDIASDYAGDDAHPKAAMSLWGRGHQVEDNVIRLTRASHGIVCNASDTTIAGNDIENDAARRFESVRAGAALTGIFASDAARVTFEDNRIDVHWRGIWTYGAVVASTIRRNRIRADHGIARSIVEEPSNDVSDNVIE